MKHKINSKFKSWKLKLSSFWCWWQTCSVKLLKFLTATNSVISKPPQSSHLSPQNILQHAYSIEMPKRALSFVWNDANCRGAFKSSKRGCLTKEEGSRQVPPGPREPRKSLEILRDFRVMKITTRNGKTMLLPAAIDFPRWLGRVFFLLLFLRYFRNTKTNFYSLFGFLLPSCSPHRGFSFFVLACDRPAYLPQYWLVDLDVLLLFRRFPFGLFVPWRKGSRHELNKNQAWQSGELRSAWESEQFNHSNVLENTGNRQQLRYAKPSRVYK